MSIDRLGAHFRRFGVSATWTPKDYSAGGTGVVIYDAQGQDVLGGAVSANQNEALYQASDFIGLDTGDTLAFGGKCYCVRTPEPVDDGQLMRVSLSEITG